MWCGEVVRASVLGKGVVRSDYDKAKVRTKLGNESLKDEMEGGKEGGWGYKRNCFNCVLPAICKSCYTDEYYCRRKSSF